MEVYLTTNNATGKKYIGANTHENKNYFGSHPAIARDIELYGINSFSKIILYNTDNIEELKRLEELAIKNYNAVHDENYYNESHLSTGFGFYGKKHTEETKNKISKKLKGLARTAEWNNKNSKANKGKYVSHETRAKISNSLTGQTAWNKGLKMTEEQKLNYRKPKAKIKCKYCEAIGSPNNITRWHNDNCKHKIGK